MNPKIRERTDDRSDILKILAVRGVQELGRTIAAKLPDIANLYRAGDTQREIAKKVRASLQLSFEIDFVRKAVQFALRQIIPEDERKVIAEHHIRQRGFRAVAEKSGVHGVLPEERVRQGQERAKNHEGLFALSHGEIKRRATKAMGAIMWEGGYTDPETGLDLGNYCFRLANDPEFFHKEGGQRGKPNYILIAAELNKIFPDLSRKSLDSRRVAYYLNYRKGKLKKVR